MTPEDQGTDSRDLHFRRREDLETDDRPYVWQDLLAPSDGAVQTVWILEDPLGMGKCSIRYAEIESEEEMEDTEASQHVATADDIQNAADAAVEWLANRPDRGE